MAKRCCAEMCFNSLASNKNITYFGFPKHAEYSKAWALAAGRQDLLEKPINNIIKYYLCSEHFTDDCFHDPPLKTRLKKSSRPLKVPFPTIFKSNIHRFVKNCNSKSNKLTSEPPRNGQIIDGKIKQLTSVPKEPETCTENIESSEGLENAHENSNVLNVNEMENEFIKDIICEDVDSDDNIKNAENNEFEYLYECDSFITIEQNLLNSNALNGNVFEEMEHDNVENEPITFLMEEKLIDYSRTCRLCANNFDDNEILINLISLPDILNNINQFLPQTIYKDDGFPQQICKTCLNKLYNCKKTVDSFIAAQNCF